MLTTAWGSVIWTLFTFILFDLVAVVGVVGSVPFWFGMNGHQENAYAIPKNDAAW
jgi:hypothetical protein